MSWGSFAQRRIEVLEKMQRDAKEQNDIYTFERCRMAIERLKRQNNSTGI